MEPREILRRETDCIADHAPACAAGCPLHLDCRAMLGLIGQGEPEGAWRLLAQQAPLPRLLAAGCAGPCRDFCVRSRCGEGIDLPALERWLLQKEIARQGLPPLTVTPYLQLSQTIAVVGGGAAGLAAAAFLYEKGFRIAIFEADAALGGSMRHHPGISRQLLEAELAFFLQNCLVKTNTRVGTAISLAALAAEYPAVIVDLPEDAAAVVCGGMLAYDPETLQLQAWPHCFWVGRSRTEPDWAQSLAGRMARGKQGAVSADRGVKQVSLTASRWRAGSYASDLPARLPEDGAESRAVAASAAEYTDEEAYREAARCLDCHCRECVESCRMLQKFGKTPRQYVREIANNLIITMGTRKANTMINSCCLCGLCGQTCPNGLDMGEICLAARQNMVQKGIMPPRLHEYPLRDMLFSVSGEFDLWREDPAGGAAYLFFPGCQLAAGAPQYMAPLYQHLRAVLPGSVGLALSCCGAPAHWAGRQELQQQLRRELLEKWRNLGESVVVTGCTTCYQELKPELPPEKLLTLWQVLAHYGLPEQGAVLEGKALAIHDPCSARDLPETRQCLRQIVADLGYQEQAMTHSGAQTRCCGYGGLAVFGNPDLAGELQERRLAEAEGDVLTYCWVCRDYLAQAAEKAGSGQQVYHILDLLLGGGLPGSRLDLSQKRASRRRLKQELLACFWGEAAAPVVDFGQYQLASGVAALLDDRLILLEDVAAVIGQAEQSGRKLRRRSDGHYFAHLRRGIVTYWVEYSLLAPGYLIHSAYSHRLEILDELDGEKKGEL